MFQLRSSWREVDLGNVIKLCQPRGGDPPQCWTYYCVPFPGSECSLRRSCAFSQSLIPGCFLCLVAMRDAAMFLAPYFQRVFAGTEEPGSSVCWRLCVWQPYRGLPSVSSVCPSALSGSSCLPQLRVYSAFLFLLEPLLALHISPPEMYGFNPLWSVGFWLWIRSLKYYLETIFYIWVVPCFHFTSFISIFSLHSLPLFCSQFDWILTLSIRSGFPSCLDLTAALLLASSSAPLLSNQ